MRIAGIFLRSVILFLLLLVPVVWVFTLFSGPIAGLIWLFVSLTGLILFIVMTETLVASLFRATRSLPKGLEASFERSLQSMGLTQESGPTLYVFDFPKTEVLVCRAFFGRGSILVSRGYLARETEARLQDTLIQSTQATQESWIPVASVSGIFYTFFKSLSSSSWFSVFSDRPLPQTSKLSVSRFILNLSILPVLNFFSWLRGKDHLYTKMIGKGFSVQTAPQDSLVDDSGFSPLYLVTGG